MVTKSAITVNKSAITVIIYAITVIIYAITVISANLLFRLRSSSKFDYGHHYVIFSQPNFWKVTYVCPFNKSY